MEAGRTVGFLDSDGHWWAWGYSNERQLATAASMALSQAGADQLVVLIALGSAMRALSVGASSSKDSKMDQKSHQIEEA